MIRVGIIGGAGYTAGELIRLLVNHPRVEIAFVHSTSNAGEPLCKVHSGLYGETEMHFCSEFNFGAVDVLFLCSAHGRSREFWQENAMPAGLKVIDLAQDFRDESEGYVYGLPELQREKIAKASKIANPGCFATAIQLALLPLASACLLPNEVEVTAITGSTGAGVKPSPTTHFSWRNNNVSVYKPFVHQHLKEICRTLCGLQPAFTGKVNFIPVRGDFARGIFASAMLDCPLPLDEVKALYRDFYAGEPFTFVSDEPVDLKQVVNTNKCIISLEMNEGKLLVCSVVDNLLKGASGLALENMNIICGLDEKAGLRLKASAF